MKTMKSVWLPIVALLQLVLLDYHYQVRLPLTAIFPISLVFGLIMMMWLDSLTIPQLFARLFFSKPKSNSRVQPVTRTPRTETKVDGQLAVVDSHSDVLPPELIDEIPEPLKPIILGGIDLIKYTGEILTNPAMYNSSNSSKPQPAIEQPNIELLD